MAQKRSWLIANEVWRLKNFNTNIDISTNRNKFSKRLFVGLLELLHDLYHVDLATRHRGTDESVILCSEAVHRIVENLGKLLRSASDNADC